MREYRFAIATAAATFVLLVIGGLVHPTGSALACGTDLLLCEGAIWPSWGPPIRRHLALLAPALVVSQVTLGLLTVWSYVALPIVALHLAVGAALLATQLSLFLLLGPRGAAVPSATTVPAVRLALETSP